MSTLDDRPAAGGVGSPLMTSVGLALGPVVALGLARFAYSLLLPAMRADLHWSFGQAGAMNTANAIGYLAGAIVAGPLLTKAGGRRPFMAGLAVTAGALLISAATVNFEALLGLRVVAGVSGAVALIAGAGLMTQLLADQGRGRSAALLGVYFAGGGLGIVISSAAVPPLLGLYGSGAWRWGWLVLGAAAVVALAAATPAARRIPEPPVGSTKRAVGWPARRLAPTLIGYGLFGAGYIGYVTFIVAYLKAQGLSPVAISAFWACLGAAAIVGAFAWGPLLGRLHGGRGPAVVLVVATVGASLPIAVPTAVGDFLSAILFGGTFLTVVTAVTDVVRRSMARAHVAPAIAGLTVAFGIGQSLGPGIAGVLSDGPGGVAVGLSFSAGTLAVAAVVAVTQKGIAAPAAEYAQK